MPDDPVTIPGQSVDSAESDILGPLQKLLAGVNVWGDSNDSTGGAFSTPDQAVAIIESGATAVYGARAQIATAFVNVAYSAARPPAQAAGPESMGPAGSQAVTGLVVSLGDQLAAIDQWLAGMDKRAALVSLAAVRKVAGTPDVAINQTVTGVTGTLQEVFLGPGQKSESEVQINVSDPSSGSVKALSLDDVIEFK